MNFVLEKIFLDIFQRRIETVLFMQPAGVPEKILLDLLLNDEVVLQEVIENLNKSYKKIDSWLQIKNVKGLYQMMLRDDVKDVVLEKYRTSVRNPSAAILETLSVIAYRQPISRSQIDAVRGVNTSGHLRYLMDLGWILRNCEELDVHCYVTTDLFLENFCLQSLADLPQTNIDCQYQFVRQQA